MVVAFTSGRMSALSFAMYNAFSMRMGDQSIRGGFARTGIVMKRKPMVIAPGILTLESLTSGTTHVSKKV
jgi:hypothetical protein